MQIRAEHCAEMMQIGVAITPNDANHPKVWKRAISLQIRRKPSAQSANKTVGWCLLASPYNVLLFGQCFTFRQGHVIPKSHHLWMSCGPLSIPICINWAHFHNQVPFFSSECNFQPQFAWIDYRQSIFFILQQPKI